jgi:hypothetical protein
MCDYIPGELLLCHNPDDAAASMLVEDIGSGEFIDHDITLTDRLEQKLLNAALRFREGIRSRFARLRVPEGQEIFKINMLQFQYQQRSLQLIADGYSRPPLDDSRDTLLISPNHYLTPRFAFNQATHLAYKHLIAWTSASPTLCPIAILDTGLDKPSNYVISDTRDFTVNHVSKNVADTHPAQHGTAIANIISDYCPVAPLTIFKVVGNAGRASEWDTIAAMVTQSSAKVINMSLVFGLSNVQCPKCGRLSHSSRSAVFQNALDQVYNSGVIVVAAAGNSAAGHLDYPARFGNALAIASVNQNLSLSSFSNRGTVNEEGKPHNRVFVAPGGERLPGSLPTEWNGIAQNGDRLVGTSIAAAYASAVVAHVWGTTQPNATAMQLIHSLQTRANTNFPAWNSTDYGNGLISQ